MHEPTETLQITEPKYQESAIEDILRLEGKRQHSKKGDYISSTMSLLIIHTTDYIRKKFRITDEMISQYKNDLSQTQTSKS
ncbi:hypothetical protein CMO89_03340 [Candidatus Woesearchaeota archaeon]|nr:hypothetical protein [Candidatus Woesearchaeota archaeon]